jgi:predicted nucleic acid-binding protein
VRRLVVDTNVYVDWMNAGRHEAVLFEKGAVKYLSAVVLMELRAGAFRTADRRLVRRVQTAFQKAGRLLVPSGRSSPRRGRRCGGSRPRGATTWLPALRSSTTS